MKEYGEFNNGIPSIDTMRRVFSALDPKEFNACFISWADHLCVRTAGEVIAIDPKTVRGAEHERSVTPHIVSAFASENGLCLGQLKVDDKSNEIFAIPALLKFLELKGNIVTIDVMGCQSAIVEQIVESEANYTIALKGNRLWKHRYGTP